MVAFESLPVFMLSTTPEIECTVSRADPVNVPSRLRNTKSPIR